VSLTSASIFPSYNKRNVARIYLEWHASDNKITLKSKGKKKWGSTLWQATQNEQEHK
jgi:hypothetical protein